MGGLLFHTLGAQLLSATGAELLYCLPWSSPKKPARGGVPVLFPQFVNCGPLQKHGWAHDLQLRLVCDELCSNQHIVEFELCIGEVAQPQWPHGALLRLQAQAVEQALCMTLQVQNTGATPFEWTGGLHPYWATSDLLATELTGLQATPLQWTGEAFEHLVDTQAWLTLKAPCHALKLSILGAV
jgi:glucose-6-phosphate 1-epimerase